MDVTLADKEFKALSSDTRRQAIKCLKERNHTLSELAKRQGISSPSMKTHMDMLRAAGLVELRDEGRKWKYYALTNKGSEIALGRKSESTVFVVLGAASVMLVAVLFMSMLSISNLQAGPNLTPQLMAEGTFDNTVEGDMVAAPVGGEKPTLEINKQSQEESEIRTMGEKYREKQGLNLLEAYTYFATAVMLAVIVGYTARVFMEKRKKA